MSAELGDWVDISRPVSSATPVWPGDTSWQFEWAWSMAEGSSVNVGALRGSTHTGSHADAPLHVDRDGDSIDRLPLSAFIGEAELIDLTDLDTVTGGASIETHHLSERVSGTAERLLLRTGCDWADGFPESFVALAPSAAAWCVEHQIRLMGTDAPSIDPFDSKSLNAHHTLLESGVVVLESLELTGLTVGRYELLALPLRLCGADASPVRAVIRRSARV